MTGLGHHAALAWMAPNDLLQGDFGRGKHPMACHPRSNWKGQCLDRQERRVFGAPNTPSIIVAFERFNAGFGPNRAASRVVWVPPGGRRFAPGGNEALRRTEGPQGLRMCAAIARMTVS